MGNEGSKLILYGKRGREVRNYRGRALAKDILLWGPERAVQIAEENGAVETDEELEPGLLKAVAHLGAAKLSELSLPKWVPLIGGQNNERVQNKLNKKLNNYMRNYGQRYGDRHLPDLAFPSPENLQIEGQKIYDLYREAQPYEGFIASKMGVSSKITNETKQVMGRVVSGVLDNQNEGKPTEDERIIAQQLIPMLGIFAPRAIRETIYEAAWGRVADGLGQRVDNRLAIRQEHTQSALQQIELHGQPDKRFMTDIVTAGFTLSQKEKAAMQRTLIALAPEGLDIWDLKKRSGKDHITIPWELMTRSGRDVPEGIIIRQGTPEYADILRAKVPLLFYNFGLGNILIDWLAEGGVYGTATFETLQRGTMIAQIPLKNAQEAIGMFDKLGRVARDTASVFTDMTERLNRPDVRPKEFIRPNIVRNALPDPVLTEHPIGTNAHGGFDWRVTLNSLKEAKNQLIQQRLEAANMAIGWGIGNDGLPVRIGDRSVLQRYKTKIEETDAAIDRVSKHLIK